MKKGQAMVNTFRQSASRQDGFITIDLDGDGMLKQNELQAGFSKGDINGNMLTLLLL